MSVSPAIFDRCVDPVIRHEVSSWTSAVAKLIEISAYPVRKETPAPAWALDQCAVWLREWASAGDLCSCGHVRLDGSERVNCFPWALVELLCDRCALTHFAYQKVLEKCPAALVAPRSG